MWMYLLKNQGLVGASSKRYSALFDTFFLTSVGDVTRDTRFDYVIVKKRLMNIQAMAMKAVLFQIQEHFIYLKGSLIFNSSLNER